MLSGRYRFHGHGSLGFVYRRGKTVRSKHFGVRLIVNNRRADSRFAVVIGKKIYKSAVKRNRIRRRIYEIIRLELPKLKPAYDVVLSVSSGEPLVLPSSELQSEINHILAQAGLYSLPGGASRDMINTSNLTQGSQ